MDLVIVDVNILLVVLALGSDSSGVAVQGPNDLRRMRRSVWYDGSATYITT